MEMTEREQLKKEKEERDLRIAKELGFDSLDEMNDEIFEEQTQTMVDIEVNAAIEMAANVGVKLVRADE